MKPLKFKWYFRAKPINAPKRQFLPKARCNLRGGLQITFIDFDPSALYDPVATLESIRLLFAIIAAYDLILEGGEISKA